MPDPTRTYIAFWSSLLLSIPLGLALQGWRFVAHPELTSPEWFWAYPGLHVCVIGLLALPAVVLVVRPKVAGQPPPWSR